ncbi:Protoheme IX farnesyltransferase, mitochondrial [Serendipita sp. 405]|nr:Protoheme IX farnesyltransferase, mitochondrial [Serendipita sp. 405]
MLWNDGRRSLPFFTSNQTLTSIEKRQDQQYSDSLQLGKAEQDTQSIDVWPSSAVPTSSYKPVTPFTVGNTLKVYFQLSKARLTTLVVLTAMSGVALSPLPVGVPVLLATAVGTTLCCASANTFNQITEVPFDAQMARTRNRPLVRKAISPLHAACFGVVTGVAGPAILLAYAGPVTAALGLGNIILYAGLYTALKRRSVVNTWVGGIVGAIPPLMGWSACGSSLLPSTTTPMSIYLPPFLNSTDLATYISTQLPALSHGLATTTPLIDNPLCPLALFLFHYAWQFPHFNPLSHLVRSSYAQAGYAMLTVIDPKKNALVSLRHSILLLFLSSFLIPLSGLTDWTFAITSLVPNAVLMGWSWKFYRNGTEKVARTLFGHSLLYLPVMLGLMMYHKRGMDWTTWFDRQDDKEKE